MKQVELLPHNEKAYDALTGKISADDDESFMLAVFSDCVSVENKEDFSATRKVGEGGREQRCGTFYGYVTS